MDDTLILGVFREFAVLKGHRTPDGEWIGTSRDFRQTLRAAMRMVDEFSSQQEKADAERANADHADVGR